MVFCGSWQVFLQDYFDNMKGAEIMVGGLFDPVPLKNKLSKKEPTTPPQSSNNAIATASQH